MNVSFSLYREFLAQYLGPFKWQAALLGFMLLCNSALSVYAPRILRDFIDSLLTSSEMVLLLQIAVWFLVVHVARQLTSGLVGYLGESVAWSTTNLLRSDMLRHALTLDLRFFQQHPPGAMLERIDGDTNQLAYFFSQFAIRFLRSLLLLTGILIAVSLDSWQLGIAVGLFMVSAIVLLFRLRSFGVPFNERLREATANLFGFVEERLSSLEDIKPLGGSVYILRQMHRFIERQVYHGRRAFSWGNLMWPATLVLLGLGTGLILAWGGYLVLNGAMTVGTIYLLFSYMNLMLWPLEELSHQMEELQKAGGNLVRVQALMATRSSLKEGTQRELGALPVKLEFQDVSFQYDEEEGPALDQVSFTVAPGRTLGILGRTGSGKTTIMRLITRLYDPSHGAVKLNGIPVSEFQLDILRTRIGVVTQEVQFFRGTLRQNLCMFDAGIGDGRIMEILHLLHLQGWLQTMPEGLDTLVTSNRLSLSAGEAQRLALARVFLRDPEIVILDEAAARLDPATEMEVDQVLQTLLAGRTSIVIAHRLQSIEKADDVLILEQGKKVEFGAREVLLAEPSSHLNQLMALGLE